ncbi:MAG: hypothetical protein HY913_00180 [Desulfomonile tiedjei]|nr:hypothetical protein [Desulfomonile tiedjei]
MTQHPSESSPSSELPPVRKPRQWKAVLLGVVILICGALIGSGITVIVVHKMVSHAISHPEEAPMRITNRIQRKLGLSEEQTAKVREIVTTRQKAITAIRKEVQPRVESELAGAKEDVAALLDPEKARRWREWFDYMRKTWIPGPPRESEGGQ